MKPGGTLNHYFQTGKKIILAALKKMGDGIHSVPASDRTCPILCSSSCCCPGCIVLRVMYGLRQGGRAPFNLPW